MPPALLFVALVATPARFGNMRAAETKADTSQAARNNAISQIPLDKFDQNMRKKITTVIKNPTIFRRLPTTTVNCNPNMYLFLVRHPEVLTSIWEKMGASQIKMQRVGEKQFLATDSDGTRCRVLHAYGGFDTQVFYAVGTYSGPLLIRPLKARCVLLLKSTYLREPDGTHSVKSRMDTFIQFDNPGVKLIAKTFQPLMGRVTDHNFRQTTMFLGIVSRAAEQKQAGLIRMAKKLPKITPEVQSEFIRAIKLVPVANGAPSVKVAVRPHSPGQRLPGQRSVLKRPAAMRK